MLPTFEAKAFLLVLPALGQGGRKAGRGAGRAYLRRLHRSVRAGDRGQADERLCRLGEPFDERLLEALPPSEASVEAARGILQNQIDICASARSAGRRSARRWASRARRRGSGFRSKWVCEPEAHDEPSNNSKPAPYRRLSLRRGALSVQRAALGAECVPLHGLQEADGCDESLDGVGSARRVFVRGACRALSQARGFRQRDRHRSLREMRRPAVARAVVAPQLVIFAAGTLDDPSWVVPTSHIFARSLSPGVAVQDDALVLHDGPTDRAGCVRRVQARLRRLMMRRRASGRCSLSWAWCSAWASLGWRRRSLSPRTSSAGSGLCSWLGRSALRLGWRGAITAPFAMRTNGSERHAHWDAAFAVRREGHDVGRRANSAKRS